MNRYMFAVVKGNDVNFFCYYSSALIYSKKVKGDVYFMELLD